MPPLGPTPFCDESEYPSTDLVLRSDDNVDFLVSKEILCVTSLQLRKCITDPHGFLAHLREESPVVGLATCGDRLVLRLDIPAEVLDAVLRTMYASSCRPLFDLQYPGLLWDTIRVLTRLDVNDIIARRLNDNIVRAIKVTGQPLHYYALATDEGWHRSVIHATAVACIGFELAPPEMDASLGEISKPHLSKEAFGELRNFYRDVRRAVVAAFAEPRVDRRTLYKFNIPWLSRREAQNFSWFSKCPRHTCMKDGERSTIKIAGGQTIPVAGWWLPVLNALVCHLEESDHMPSLSSLIAFVHRVLPLQLPKAVASCLYCGPGMSEDIHAWCKLTYRQITYAAKKVRVLPRLRLPLIY